MGEVDDANRQRARDFLDSKRINPAWYARDELLVDWLLAFADAEAMATSVTGHMTDDVRAALLLAQDALRWCSGSPDFNVGGQARVGWLAANGPIAALDAISIVLGEPGSKASASRKDAGTEPAGSAVPGSFER